jgi:Transposase IS116/IS110/IS902 family
MPTVASRASHIRRALRTHTILVTRERSHIETHARESHEASGIKIFQRTSNSYCGLCGAEKSSGNTVQRTPLCTQRNKHLQTTLIEAAKMASRNSPELVMLYDQEKQKGNANRATLAVARKLVAYLTGSARRSVLEKQFDRADTVRDVRLAR